MLRGLGGSNQTPKDDEMVWVIDICARISKYAKNTEDKFKYIRNRLDITAWIMCQNRPFISGEDQPDD